MYDYVVGHVAFCAVVPLQWLGDSVVAGLPVDGRKYYTPGDPEAKSSGSAD